MSMVPLRDVVAEAHRALESGDYAVARAACQHILAHFPSFADTHRLHGEILLEQGETEGARGCFDQALAFDPRNVLATLGLGVIAEESLDLAGAAGYFQRALEIDPSLTQLRDELVRLYSKLYGQGGRLHVSGAGLAAIYARGNQFTLAQRQYEALLERYPERIDLTLALAEVRWRAGDTAGVQDLCQRVLAAHPRTARALYLQADLYRRHGAADKARELLAAAAAIDPVGDIARALEQSNPGSRFADLDLPAPEVPAFDAAAAATEAAMPTTNSTLGVTAPPVEESEWQRITTELNASLVAGGTDAEAPAADFTWPWEADAEADDPALPDLAAAAAALSATDSPAGDGVGDEIDQLLAGWESAGDEIAAATPGGARVRGYTDTLKEFDALGFKPFDIDATIPPADDLPTDLSALDLSALDAAAADAAPPAEPAGEPGAGIPSPAVSVADVEAALQELVGNWDQIDAELANATPRGPAAGFDDLTAQLTSAGMTPFAAEPEPIAALESLAAGWDDLDSTLSAATPTAHLPRGFTRELEALDAEGLEPFDFAELDASLATQFEAVASSQPTAEPAPPAPPPPLPTKATTSDLDRTWADLEAELNAATPVTTSLPPGFTAELRSFDDEGLTPFLPDDLLDVAEPATPAPPPPAPDLETALGLEPLPATPPSSPAPPAIAPPSFTMPGAPAAEPSLAALFTPTVQAAPPPAPVPTPPAAATMPPAPLPRPTVAPPAARPPMPPAPLPTQFGSTIGLAGSLFGRLQERKDLLVESGALVVRRAAPARPIGSVAAAQVVQQAEAASDALPADPVARRHLADAYAAAGQPADATACYRLLLRSEPAMLADLAAPIEELAGAYPAIPAVARLRGDLYMRQGRYSQAMAVYRSLLLAGPSA